MLRLGRQLLISWLANALVLGILVAVMSGVEVDDGGDLLKAALLFGVLNTVLKPVLRALTLPIAFITLGLIWFAVSMLMLWLTDLLIRGFDIQGFRTLVWATIVVWILNVILDFVPGPWRGTRRD